MLPNSKVGCKLIHVAQPEGVSAYQGPGCCPIRVLAATGTLHRLSKPL